MHIYSLCVGNGLPRDGFYNFLGVVFLYEMVDVRIQGYTLVKWKSQWVGG